MRINHYYVLFGFMLLAAILGERLRPTHLMAQDVAPIELERLIPTQTKHWRVQNINAQLVNPQTEAAIKKIYAQTLSRTYVNDKGDVIMLSIAYGKDQSDSVGAHLPEGCYGGQGFTVSGRLRTTLKTAFNEIPVTKLLATQSERVEPITYWLRTGHHVAYPDWDTKLLKLQYAFNGDIPDGLLMRVSSLTHSNSQEEVAGSYKLQAQFINELLVAVLPSQRLSLIGEYQ